MVYVLLTDGFEDIEALEPIDIMRRAEIPVKTVGIDDKTVVSSHGVTVLSDILIDDVDKKDMDMLVLPGGPGHTNLDASKKVHDLISYAYENGIYIAAICASPSIIGKMGLLKNKRYTCFPGFEDIVIGGIHTSDKAVLDDKILTARGAGAAADFGFKMVEIFKGMSIAENLKRQMQY